MSSQEPYIGIFNDSFPPIIDGVTLTVLNYADKFIQRKENICVVTPYNPIKVEVPYKVMRYFSLPIRSRKPYRYGYPKLDPYIWRKLKETPFKIIHSHSPFAAGRLGVYAKRKQGIPLIGTFHSKYKSDLKHSFKLMPFCVPIIMKRILNFYRACDEVWIPQAAVEETVREYGFEGEVYVMENGNDFADVSWNYIDKIKNRNQHPDSPKLNLLFVGQHIWEKGIGIIADALSMISDKIDFEMFFIGEGYAKEDLKKKIEQLGLTDKVRFIGVTNDREVLKEYYGKADLFLFPSKYDNAPLVVREAAAMGTPAIIPSGSTASEVIKNRENGFLIEDSPEAYAAEIIRLSGNYNEIDACGRRAKDTLVKSWDDVIDEVYGRYENLMASYSNKQH